MCWPAFSAAVKTAVTRAPIPESSSEASDLGGRLDLLLLLHSLFHRRLGRRSLCVHHVREYRPLRTPNFRPNRCESRDGRARARASESYRPSSRSLNGCGLTARSLSYGEVGDRATGEELDEQRVGRRPLQRAAHGAGVVRPGPAQREIQAEQGQRRDESDGKGQEDAQVLRGVPAVASARLGAPPGLLDLVGDGGDLAPDEGDAPEVPDEAARLLDRHAGRDDGVRELAEVPHLAPDEQREREPEDDPQDGDDVEEADQAHACGRKRKSHARSLPAPTRRFTVPGRGNKQLEHRSGQAQGGYR